MATNRFASSVVTRAPISEGPLYPWRSSSGTTDADITDRGPIEPLYSDELMIAEWSRAHAELHACEAPNCDASRGGKGARSQFKKKLQQLRAVWPLLQLGEIHTMKRGPRSF